jgi:aspartyl-tRNA(Asn)/glutamyl-tRNA(Gln) amidotransferase subunit A
LPIGVQFLAGHFEEAKLIQIAAAYEKNTNLEKRRPPL